MSNEKIMKKFTEKITDAYVAKLKKQYLEAESIKPKIFVFDGETFLLASVAPINGGLHGYVNEYLTQGDSFPKWKKLVGLHYYPGWEDPLRLIRLLQEQLKRQGMPSIVYSTGDKNSYIFCSIMAALDKNSTQPVTRDSLITEINVWKYKFSKDIDATIGLQYTIRFYGTLQEKEFAETYKRLFTELAVEMYYAPFPELYRKI